VKTTEYLDDAIIGRTPGGSQRWSRPLFLWKHESRHPGYGIRDTGCL